MLAMIRIMQYQDPDINNNYTININKMGSILKAGYNKIELLAVTDTILYSPIRETGRRANVPA